MSAKFPLIHMVAAALCLTTAATASPIVIDDFEYWGWPMPMVMGPWQDVSPGPSTAQLTLTADAPQGTGAGVFDFHIAGGWMEPTEPANYDSWDTAGMSHQFDPIDFQPGGEIHMFLRLPYGWDIMDADFMSIDWGGDQWAQTWIPGPGASDLMWWMDPSRVPAWIGPDGWSPPWVAGMLPEWWPNPVQVISPDDGWVEIVIDENMWLDWGAELVDFTAMDSITLLLWGNGDAISVDPKMDGTNFVYPEGPLDATVYIDYIYYIPEPTTIAILALGALAVLKKKRS